VPLAVHYDIHGHLPALEAVVADARGRGAERFLLGGDYALFGGWPGETVMALRELDAPALRGNGERWTAVPDEAPADPVVQAAITACREALGEATVAELAALPESLEHGTTKFWHGSPASDVRSFAPTPAPDEAELLEGVEESRLVFGHTHLPFRRLAVQGVELVNPGSVGMPFDGDPRAAYAVIGDDGGVEHHRVAYDHAASAAALRERFTGPWTGVVAQRIETARFE
jgi:diadenosine tetraphosphatase ApaH/serine/threonine PP2A family protein phosphatase